MLKIAGSLQHSLNTIQSLLFRDFFSLLLTLLKVSLLFGRRLQEEWEKWENINTELEYYFRKGI